MLRRGLARLFQPIATVLFAAPLRKKFPIIQGDFLALLHKLVEIPPKIAVSSFMGYLKGKSSTMLYEQFGELKYKYRNREFWCKGYYVDTVGKNESRIAEYIENQLKEDEMGEQLSMSQYGPFTGGKK